MAGFYLVRHGEPTRRGVFLGALDLELSPAGILQAGALPAQLLDVEWVYASPLLRARQTAANLGKPVTELDELREIAYGPWEGLTWAEIEVRYPVEAKRKLADWQGYTVPGAEPWMDFEARVGRAYETLMRNKQTIAVVAHLGVNGMLRQLHTGETAMSFEQEYCEVLRFEF